MNWILASALQILAASLVALAIGMEPVWGSLSAAMGLNIANWSEVPDGFWSWMEQIQPLALLMLASLLPRILSDQFTALAKLVLGTVISITCLALAMAVGLPAESVLVFLCLSVIFVMAERFGVIKTGVGVSQSKLARATAKSSDAIILVNNKKEIQYANNAAKRMCGTNPERYTLERLFPSVDWSMIGGDVEGPDQKIDTELVQESLSKLPVEISLSNVGRATSPLAMLRIVDVTEQKRQIEELRQMALRDPLTGLANRALFEDRMEQALASAERESDQLAVLLLDLDRFKQVNDTLGHHVGDMLLQNVGPRLAEPLRKSDTLARLGGDEFSIILSHSISLQQACKVAERIVERLAEPFEIDGMSLEIGTSIGVALYPEHGTNHAALVKNADTAMYKAKRERLGFCVFDSEDRVSNLRRVSLQRGLRQAIDEDHLVLYMQPKIHAGTRELVGCEALVRWQHDKFGTLGPDEFIPIAEQTGLIMPLTLWVFNACLKAQERWRQNGLDVPVAINLSPRWLADSSFPKILKLLLHSWEGRPDRFILEVTERAINNDPKKAMSVLKGLSDIGCKLSLDDFGTGYSSLGNLQKLPIDELKIDKSFVAHMGEDENSAIVVRSIVKLAHALGLQVVAEGVESAKIANYLTSMGCDVLQGYFVGRPATLEDFDKWLLGGGTLLDEMEQVPELQ